MIDFLKDIFSGHDVFIVAGGPSLSDFDFSRLKGKKTIAVNHSYEYVKEPDLLCFLDSKFSLAISSKGHKLQDFVFPCLAGPQAYEKYPNIIRVNTEAKDPSENTSENLFVKRKSGGTSAALAISAALFAGARNIYLLGVDLYVQGDKKHFYSDDFTERGIWESDPTEEIRFERMFETFDAFKSFKNIYNLSEHSRVETFPKKNLNEVL